MTSLCISNFVNSTGQHTFLRFWSLKSWINGDKNAELYVNDNNHSMMRKLNVFSINFLFQASILQFKKQKHYSEMCHKFITLKERDNGVLGLAVN